VKQISLVVSRDSLNLFNNKEEKYMLKKKMDLRIKLLTLPFTEIEFYHSDKIEELSKYEDLKNYDDKLRNTLMDSIYTIIHRRLAITNLDELQLLFRCYYDKAELDESFVTYSNISSYYMRHLSKLSKIFLTHRNGKVSLKYWKTNDEDELLGPYSGIYKIVLWNSMNRMFTTDLLVMQYLLDNNMEDEYYLLGYHSVVDIQDIQLEQVLSQGIAETHIHMNAGGDFIVIWQDLMSLCTDKNSERYKKKEKMQDWDKVIGKNFGLKSYIKAMAILRILLAYFLKMKGNLVEHTTFEMYYQENHFGLSQDLEDFINSIYKGYELKENSFHYEEMYDTIKEHLQIRDEVTIPPETPWSQYLAKKDILNGLIHMEGDFTTVENIFLFRAIKYMRSNEGDSYFSKLFWQYIRVKNEVFQLKVQGNTIQGLDNFKQYYNRSTDLSYQNKDSLGLILHTQFNNYNLKKIELRVGMPKDNKNKNNKNAIKKNLIRNLIIFFNSYRDVAKELIEQQRDIPAIGLVYHFLKRPDPTGIEKCWLENQSGESLDLYFKSVQEAYKAQLSVLNELREEVDGLADYIVGIDAASGENDTEPWVFAPLYEIARNSDSHKLVYKSRPHKRIRNLGFTFHAGEDFRHILTGLRRIDEVIRQFKFHAGDRIGHAIALGIDTNKWALGNKVVILPRIEYLENLLWIWGLHKEGNLLNNIDIAYLEQKILIQAEKIYINVTGITVFNLWKAYQSKFKAFNKSDKYKYETVPKRQNELLCKNISNEHTITWTEEKLVHAQHCRCYLKGMLQPIQIEVTQGDNKIIEEIQNLVARNISREGIVVEVNPTSNTSIGQVENIFEHYVGNLNRHGLSDMKVENGIMVTINTDDPSVFNTNINNEFAYIFYSLKEKGYAREDILLWIDKVRRNGLNSSFIETREISNEQRINELTTIIDTLNSL
jgi:adenosine deaminase